MRSTVKGPPCLSSHLPHRQMSSQRTNEDSTSLAIATNVNQPTHRERDDTFWFEDGTISLIAGGTKFKVYKGVLAAHSPVFADMFALASPDSPNSPSGSTSPVVHLSDSPEDLRHILRVIIPPPGNEKCLSPVPCAHLHIHAILNVSSGLCTSVPVQCLTPILPSSLYFMRTHSSDSSTRWTAL